MSFWNPSRLDKDPCYILKILSIWKKDLAISFKGFASRLGPLLCTVLLNSFSFGQGPWLCPFENLSIWDKGPGYVLLKSFSSGKGPWHVSFWNPSHLGQGPWLCPFEVLLHGEEGQHECGVGSKQTTNHRRLLLLPILKQPITVV